MVLGWSLSSEISHSTPWYMYDTYDIGHFIYALRRTFNIKFISVPRRKYMDRV